MHIHVNACPKCHLPTTQCQCLAKINIDPLQLAAPITLLRSQEETVLLEETVIRNLIYVIRCALSQDTTGSIPHALVREANLAPGVQQEDMPWWVLATASLGAAQLTHPHLFEEQS